jgi:hypothetical protein
LERQQTASELDSLVARIVEISPSDDAQTGLQIDHFILLVVMDCKAEISVGDDKIKSFEAVFTSLFEGALNGEATGRSLQHFFDEQSSGAIRTEGFENPAVADPDENSMLIDSQPSSATSLIEWAQNARFARLDARRMTSPIVKLLAVGGHKDRSLWNHAILNGDQAHRNISTFYGWSVGNEPRRNGQDSRVQSVVAGPQ